MSTVPCPRDILVLSKQSTPYPAFAHSEASTQVTMVRRASSVPHLNSSGGSSADSAGTSGSRRGRAPVAGSRGRKTPSTTSTGQSQRQSSGSSSSMPRSRSLTNGMRRLSPQKGTGSSGGAGGGGGSSRNTPYFLRSRENE